MREAIILAGGKATRLGDAARGLPKALIPIAGHPLAEYQVTQLVRAGVRRIIVSCAAAHRQQPGPVYALNGDELHEVDLEALLDSHARHGGAATIVIAPLMSQFGVVEIEEDDRISGFLEAPRLPHWVNAGVYVLDEEAIERLPEHGDHEDSTFPELAGEGKLFAFRYEGLWITVNTPKDVQRAERHYAEHPELRPTLARNRAQA